MHVDARLLLGIQSTCLTNQNLSEIRINGLSHGDFGLVTQALDDAAGATACEHGSSRATARCAFVVPEQPSSSVRCMNTRSALSIPLGVEMLAKVRVSRPQIPGRSPLNNGSTKES